jgi:hypothetical protein
MTSREFCLLLLLCALLSRPGLGQQTTPVPRASLRILVLEGEGAVNVPSLRIFTPPIVEVRDDNDRPVERAEVTFYLPAAGPGAHFPNQELIKTVPTNSQGQAAALGFAPNSQLGNFRIRVTARFGTLTGEARINQSNAATLPAQKKEGLTSWRPSWWKLALLGAGGGTAAGIIAATRGGGSQNSAAQPLPTVVITPGTVVFGGGR